MPEEQGSGTTPQGAAQTDKSSGKDYSEVGALNDISHSQPSHDPLAQEFQAQSQTVMEQQPEIKGQQQEDTKPEPQSQPTKEERHFSKKINEMNESLMSFARKAVEKDPDSIYDIAQDDPKLAEKLVKEFDYGVDTLDELLQQKENPDEKPEAIKRKVEEDKRLSAIEQELFDEKVKRLKTEHDDLDDDLIEEYKKVYSNDAFKGKTEKQMLSIARASLGKETSTSKVDNSALEILRNQEGFGTSPRQVQQKENRHTIPQDVAHHYRDSGVTEKDLEEYLPPDFEKEIAYAYGHLGDNSAD